MDIEWLRARISAGQYVVSVHAERERLAEDIDLTEIEEVLLRGHILEDYPTDRRGASCLVLGFAKGRAIHVVCGQRESHVVVITVYLPLPPVWTAIDQRKKREDEK